MATGRSGSDIAAFDHFEDEAQVSQIEVHNASLWQKLRLAQYMADFQRRRWQPL
jgi:hypothetical protein